MQMTRRIWGKTVENLRVDVWRDKSRSSIDL
jgi:hypothetical protein